MRGASSKKGRWEIRYNKGGGTSSLGGMGVRGLWGSLEKKGPLATSVWGRGQEFLSKREKAGSKEGRKKGVVGGGGGKMWGGGVRGRWMS